MDFYHPLWPVFYEDNHLLVLYKPAGLIMQRGNGRTTNLLDLAKAWIKTKYAKPGNVFAGMVHRLDAPVAGVIVVARTSKAAARLSAQFRENQTRKIYLAVVQGCPPRSEGHVTHRLVRRGRLSAIAAENDVQSKEAKLSYRVVDKRGDESLLEVRLETGRRHQIRLQLATMGCPIAGDVSYGAGRALADGRIALLARSLTLTHPTRNVPMTFECPFPQGWPWEEEAAAKRPLWTIEEFQEEGFQSVLSPSP